MPSDLFLKEQLVEEGEKDVVRGNWVFCYCDFPELVRVSFEGNPSEHFDLRSVRDRRQGGYSKFYSWWYCQDLKRHVSYDLYRKWEAESRVAKGLWSSERADRMLRFRSEFLPWSRAMNNDELLAFSANHKIEKSGELLRECARKKQGGCLIHSPIVHVGQKGLVDGGCECLVREIPKGEFFEVFFSFHPFGLHQVSDTWYRDKAWGYLFRLTPPLDEDDPRVVDMICE